MLSPSAPSDPASLRGVMCRAPALPQFPDPAAEASATISSNKFRQFWVSYPRYAPAADLQVSVPGSHGFPPGKLPVSSKKRMSSFCQSFSRVTSHLRFQSPFLAPLLSFNPAHITLAVNYLKQANTCNKLAFCQTQACSGTDTLTVSLSRPS